jgi:hypothetical protein
VRTWTRPLFEPDGDPKLPAAETLENFKGGLRRLLAGITDQ